MRILNTRRIGENYRETSPVLRALYYYATHGTVDFVISYFSGKLKEKVRKINPTNKIGQNIFFLGNLSSNRFF